MAASETIPDFKLSAVLRGHTSDVRAVLMPDPSFALTASRDGSTRVWKRTSTSPPTYDPDESSHGAQFKTCLAYAPPSKEYADGLVLSAGQDTLIEARQPTTTADHNADAVMVGHSNQVCSLDMSPRGDWFVSGSWDSTARVWQVGRWESDVELTGHTATVWAVLAYSRDMVVTGSADRGIRIFDVRGKLLETFDGRDIVRALVKLPEDHASGAQFAAASNDGVIRFWKLNGRLVAELHGHEAFIYSLAILPSGELVSSGEDRTVRVWRGTECVQVITIPAISVWSISTSPEGDIIAGSSDKIARIFTRSSDRIADAETVQEFDQSVQSSALPKEQVGDINMSDLPGPEFLTQKSGTKEGQTAIVKDDSGNPTVYQWSMSQQTWIQIGQVVDSSGSSSTKASYNGRDYDYVFDIDIEDGKPALKLPYNVTQNPYEAATKFLQDNELPISYLEETANFIIKNTQGASLGAQTGGVDAWGSENRYRPGEIPQSSYKPPPSVPKASLPQKDYLPIVMGKPGAAIRQITKLNSEYTSQGSDMALSSSDLDSLTKLVNQLDKYDFQGKPSLGASIVEPGMSSLSKIINTWEPLPNRLAGLDLLRFIAVAAKEFPVDETSSGSAANVFSSKIFDGQLMDKNNKLAMIGFRFFSNLLYGSESGRILVQIHADDVIRHMQTGSYLAHSDVSLAVAITTLGLNLAVLITTERTDQSEQQGLQLIELLGRILSYLPAVDHGSNALPLAQTTEPAYRALVALGTVIVSFRSSDVKKASLGLYKIPQALDELTQKKYLNEPRFKKVADEIRKALA